MTADRLKWIKNGIVFTRGKYMSLAVRFDNSVVWFTPTSKCAATSFQAIARELARTYGAKTVEVRRLRDVVGSSCGPDVVCFFKDFDGAFRFRTEVDGKAGSKRAFRYYEARELFVGADTVPFAQDEAPANCQAWESVSPS